jgi:hypothetical protein
MQWLRNKLIIEIIGAIISIDDIQLEIEDKRAVANIDAYAATDAHL